MRVPARTVIIATGAAYRRLELENLAQFEGAGVYYGATFIEAQLCRGSEVVVVGGGNSAGPGGGVPGADAPGASTCWCAARGLADTMSRYLIRRIEDNPAITLLTETEIVGLEGDSELERVRWRHGPTGAGRDPRHPPRLRDDRRDAEHRVAATAVVALDAKRVHQDRAGPARPRTWPAAGWPLSRPPHLLETSLPGVFAVGDVRGGNIKRVASAVGEGAIAVAFVHRVLAE